MVVATESPTTAFLAFLGQDNPLSQALLAHARELQARWAARRRSRMPTYAWRQELDEWLRQELEDAWALWSRSSCLELARAADTLLTILDPGIDPLATVEAEAVRDYITTL